MAAGASNDIVNDWGDNAVSWAMRHNNLRIAKEVGGADFERLAARPPGSFGPAIRSLAVPDRADELMAQARRLEAQGRRKEAMKLYSAALTAIKQAEAKNAAAAKAAEKQNKARAVTGLTISARRAKPEEQSAGLSYQTPALAGASRVGASRVDVGDNVASGQTAPTANVGNDPNPGTSVPSSAASPRANISSPVPVSRETTAEAWFARARELEASGRRKEALMAYREAAAFLRQRP
jgi:tetratricopeptide (TPR) repeat protein